MEREHWTAPPRWWKKWKPLRWAAAGAIVFFLFSTFYVAKVIIAPGPHEETERFTATAPGIVLLDGIKSYDSVDSVRTRLDTAQVVYTLTPLYPPESHKYPPRDRDTLQALEYTHLGVVGQLTLEFFNDRLYEATFVPSDPAAYADKLHSSDQRLKRDRNGRAQQVIGNLRVASNVAFAATEVGRSLQTKPFVIWQDLRLIEMLDEWDRRFVALPQKS